MNSIIYHNRICQALLERDAETAAQMMKEHLASGLAFVREIAGDQDLPEGDRD